MKILFRDFKTAGLDELKKIVEKVVAEVQPMYPKAKIEIEVKEQYRNMREGLEKDTRVIDYLFEAQNDPASSRNGNLSAAEPMVHVLPNPVCPHRTFSLVEPIITAALNG